MKKLTAVAVFTVLVASLVGCTLKMGNTSAGLLEGWNQPTVNQKTVEVQTPAPTVVK